MCRFLHFRWLGFLRGGRRPRPRREESGADRVLATRWLLLVRPCCLARFLRPS